MWERKHVMVHVLLAVLFVGRLKKITNKSMWETWGISINVVTKWK